MTAQKEYKYPKNWLKNNLIAIPTGFIGGNCSPCIFRNAPNYCKNMTCTYNDEHGGSVYWIGRETHANIGTWEELRQFFDTTPKQKIRDISYEIMKKAILLKRREKPY